MSKAGESTIRAADILRLFPPFQLSKLATLQDGGLKHNNPVKLAIWECRQIWPAFAQPDFVLSLGTGTYLEESAPSVTADFRHVILDGFLPRLWRSFMLSLDGETTWRDLWNSLAEEHRDRYFRGNIHLEGTTIPIDDIDAMVGLRKCVRTYPEH